MGICKEFEVPKKGLWITHLKSSSLPYLLSTVAWVRTSPALKIGWCFERDYRHQNASTGIITCFGPTWDTISTAWCRGNPWVSTPLSLRQTDRDFMGKHQWWSMDWERHFRADIMNNCRDVAPVHLIKLNVWYVWIWDNLRSRTVVNLWSRSPNLLSQPHKSTLQTWGESIPETFGWRATPRCSRCSPPHQAANLFTSNFNSQR